MSKDRMGRSKVGERIRRRRQKRRGKKQGIINKIEEHCRGRKRKRGHDGKGG